MLLTSLCFRRMSPLFFKRGSRFWKNELACTFSTESGASCRRLAGDHPAKSRPRVRAHSPGYSGARRAAGGTEGCFRTRRRSALRNASHGFSATTCSDVGPLSLFLISSPLLPPLCHLGEWWCTLLEPTGKRTRRICIPSHFCLSRVCLSSPKYLTSVTFLFLLCKVRIIIGTLWGCSEGWRWCV